MKTFVLVFTMIWSLSVFADAYQYTDDKGVVHYSDKPVPGATKVKTLNKKSDSRDSGDGEEATLETVEVASSPKRELAPCQNPRVINEDSSADSRGKSRSICMDDK